MKILFVIPALGSGGQERQLAELASGLVRHGHVADVAVPYPGDHYEQFLIERGVRVIALRPQARAYLVPPLRVRLMELFHRMRALRKLVREEKYDIVHGYGDTANVYSSFAGNLRRRHAVVWGIRASEKVGNGYALKILPILSRKVDLVICNSHAGARFIREAGCRPHKLEVIPNGIDVDRCAIDDAARNDVRTRLGVRSDEKLVGIIGNLHPRKGISVLIEAASKVDRSLKCKFLVIGGDWHNSKPHLNERIDSLGIRDVVTLHDPVPDSERYMNALDVLVSASYTEGFSNVLAEGMACGVPCVATDVGDSAVILGSLGEVVPPGDSTAMALAIEQVVRGKYPDRQAIRDTITNQYTIDKLIERTETAFRQVMR